jgi:Stress responsive A/B Barrel Domain
MEARHHRRPKTARPGHDPRPPHPDPRILETNVGVNFSPRSLGYEFAGVMKFADRAAMDAYNTHPVHLELLSWLIPLIEPIEVDFEA